MSNKQTLRIYMVVASFLVVGVIAYVHHYLNDYYSIRNAVSRLESGQIQTGSSMMSLNPSGVYGIDSVEFGERYRCYLGKDDSGVLLMFAWNKIASTDKYALFAAHYLPKEGNEKWFFCDTNRFGRYLAATVK